MKKIFLISGLLIFGSCAKDELNITENNLPIVEPINCDCGSVLELGTNYLTDSVSGIIMINDYWMRVENHCSQNSRRFSISQDQIITTYLGDTVCFYNRW
jgi:hypothetical protein